MIRLGDGGDDDNNDDNNDDNDDDDDDECRWWRRWWRANKGWMREAEEEGERVVLWSPIMITANPTMMTTTIITTTIMTTTIITTTNVDYEENDNRRNVTMNERSRREEEKWDYDEEWFLFRNQSRVHHRHYLPLLFHTSYSLSFLVLYSLTIIICIIASIRKYN